MFGKKQRERIRERIREEQGKQAQPQAPVTATSETPIAPTQPPIVAAPKSNMTKNILIGVGAVVLVVAAIVIVKKLRK